MIDLNIRSMDLDAGGLALVEHRCGCRAYWRPWKNRTTWVVELDSPWRICPTHRDELRGVRRPTRPDHHECFFGYPWVRR